MAIETWVAIQFFEVTIVQIGSFALSVQKVVALVVLPIALLALRRCLIPLTLLSLVLLMFAANSLWYMAGGAMLDSRLIGADTTALTVAFGATTLYTGLVAVPDGLERLATAWTRWAWFTSAVCVLQALGLVPLFNVPREMILNRATTLGLERAVGFKVDPNFQALMLVIGALFVASVGPRGVRRTVGLALIGLGILATFSRMGLLLFALILFGAPLIQVVERRGVRRAILGSILAAAVLVGLFALAVAKGLVPAQVEAFLAGRFLGAWRALAALSSGQNAGVIGGGPIDSAITRLVLAFASIRVFLANPWIGIGAGRSEDVLQAMTGLPNVSHNTYLEMAVTGGLVGVGFLVIYALPAVRLLRAAATDTSGLALQRVRSTAVALYVIFGLVFFLLSLNSNSILYLPVITALALTRGAEGRLSEGLAA